VPDPPPGEPPLPAWVVLLGVVVLTLLLSVWAAFLVPVRIHGFPVPFWLLPLAAMLGLALAAARRAGTGAAVLLGGLWGAVNVFGFGTTRTEGDLVVPGTPSGYAYLFGGFALWLAVIARAASAQGPVRPTPRRQERR